MRNTVAKRLRDAASMEVKGANAPERDLVWGTSSVINHPQSIRALYLRLKQSWKKASSNTPEPKHIVARHRKPSDFMRPQNNHPLALILSPLRHLTRSDDKSEPTLRLAAAAARAGRGHVVQRLARMVA